MKSKKKYIIGVDVGKTGYISILNLSGNYITSFKMPIVKNEFIIDFDELKENLKPYKNSFVIIEKQQPYPSQGVCSVFCLGQQFGSLIGFFICFLEENDIIYLVHPKTWQKHFGIKKEKEGTKALSFMKCVELGYNETLLKTKRGKIIDGLCDSILISKYYQETMNV